MKKFFIFIFCLAVFLLSTFKVKADCDANCLKGQIDEYNQKIHQLQGQANTLSNQVASFNAQIRLTELKIEQTEEEIKLLGNRIDQLTVSLNDLKEAFSARAVETYKMSRMDGPLSFILSSSNLSDAVDRFHFLEKAQEGDQSLLARLTSAQDTYKTNKSKSEDLQKDLKDEEVNLNAQKIAKAQLLTNTQNDETKYQQLLATAQAQLSAMQNFVSGQGGASILGNQTFKNDWGTYYNQRDSGWGNHGLGTSSLSVANYGCLISSSAMIATHYGKNLNPLDIASNGSAFFSPDAGTALLWRDITVNGVRIIRNSIGANTANIDSELGAGRPVIVGLYNGPAHFIVIKSGSNGNYVMNDPFMENGHDVNFTSKYSVSNITDVESISIQ